MYGKKTIRSVLNPVSKVFPQASSWPLLYAFLGIVDLPAPQTISKASNNFLHNLKKGTVYGNFLSSNLAGSLLKKNNFEWWKKNRTSVLLLFLATEVSTGKNFSGKMFFEKHFTCRKSVEILEKYNCCWFQKKNFKKTKLFFCHFWSINFPMQ